MSKSTYKHFGLLFLLILALATGCKTRKEGSSTRVRGLDKEKIVERHNKNRPDFKVLSLKGKADYENLSKKDKIGFSYKIDIAKDSLILASVSKFGIPALNVLMTTDSIFVRNVLDKSATICDFSLVSEMLGFGVDFAMMQNFLVGDAKFIEPMVLSSGRNEPIELKGNVKGYSVYWNLNDSHFRLEKMRLKDLILGQESELSYTDFKKVGAYQMASSMQLKVTQPEELRIDLHHTDIDFDKESVSFKFRIPESYEIKPCSKPGK
jgi:hypothetical protein